MRIWTVELIVKWSYHTKNESGVDMSYDVAAKTGEAAIEKAKKIAMRDSGWTDGEGDKHTIISISLNGLLRGRRIHA